MVEALRWSGLRRSGLGSSTGPPNVEFTPVIAIDADGGNHIKDNYIKRVDNYIEQATSAHNGLTSADPIEIGKERKELADLPTRDKRQQPSLATVRGTMNVARCLVAWALQLAVLLVIGAFGAMVSALSGSAAEVSAKTSLTPPAMRLDGLPPFLPPSSSPSPSEENAGLLTSSPPSPGSMPLPSPPPLAPH